MNNNLPSGLGNDSRPLSVVITPLSEYIVVKHTNPEFKETSAWYDNYFKKRGYTYCLQKDAIKREGLSERIKSILMKTPGYAIKEDEDRTGKYKIPGGTIRELFSKEHISQFASRDKKYEDDLIREYKIKPENIVGGIPSMEQYVTHANWMVGQIIWKQLIKESSENRLEFIQKDPPYFVKLDKEWLFIADNGIASNCGYGVANAFVYKIHGIEETPVLKGAFSHYEIYLEEPYEAQFKFLSGGEMISHDLKEIEKKELALFFTIDGNLAMLSKKEGKRWLPKLLRSHTKK